ncbi:MAG TPA: protein kinase [Acidimicrobiales bacterium]|nr:protein kinase [Acidimicrobiales bacterium]
MPEAPRHVDAERVLGGRYRLERRIASGGMAEVWEAQDEVLGRRVATKVLYRHLATDQSFLERFRREAIAAARLAHASVVATYDTGVDDDVAWIVMELVEGRTLREELAQRGALSPARAVHIATQVADALDYAHRAGVIHRDVKPGNILITEDDRVKVADFGIAKAAIEAAEDASGAGAVGDLTRSGDIVGTAKYLSPEQVNGDAVDGRSDVYALGVVLYEMLCGRPPFTGETEVALAMQHLQAAPTPPRQVRAGIPRSLEAVVLRAMAKSPDERFPTAGQLHTALLSVDLRPDDADPVVVRQDTPPGGTPPTFAQSERSWMVPTLVIVVLAVTLGVVGVLFARSNTGQRLLNDRQPEPAEGARALAVTHSAFDPQGDGHEHDSDLPRLTDGDVASVWETERYSSRQFGGLKSGVGVVLQLEGSQRLGQLEVSSPSRGWSAQVYVADAPKSAAPPAEWGEAAASRTGIDGDARFDLNGRQGAAVLVWITDLGDANAVSVGEVRLVA